MHVQPDVCETDTVIPVCGAQSSTCLPPHCHRTAGVTALVPAQASPLKESGPWGSGYREAQSCPSWASSPTAQE